MAAVPTRGVFPVGVMDASPELIERRFSDRLGHQVRLRKRRLAGEGYSDETAILTFDCADGEPLKVVARVFRPGAMARQEVDPLRLHRLLSALGGTKIPVPKALWFDDSPDVFGTPYSVVSWMPGEAVVPWSAEGRRLLAKVGANAVGHSFPQILAAIHELDWRDLGLTFLTEPTAKPFAVAKVDELEDYLARVRQGPEPILVDGLGWLRANLPAPGRTSLIHGDYRSGNLLIDNEDISAVLDWEFATLGDPLYDVGWVCSPSNRTGTDLTCYLMAEREFLDRYERASSTPVDPAALHFWMIFHQVRGAVIWLETTQNVTRGATNDLRLARMQYSMPVMRKMVADLLEYA